MLHHSGALIASFNIGIAYVPSPMDYEDRLSFILGHMRPAFLTRIWNSVFLLILLFFL
jgi:hypothetical protein